MSDHARRIASLSPEKLDLLMRTARKGEAENGQTLIQPQKREGQPFPLSFAQQRLWFLDQWEPGSPFYNIPTVLRLRGPLHRKALQGSLSEIVWCHEALRTTFGLVEGQPVQLIGSASSVELPLIDLQALPDVKREAAARHLAFQEAQLPFDLAKGPLLRTRLLCLSPNEHCLLLTMHHIVSDGWSIGIFLRELTALYTAYSRDQPSSLSPLPIQYADFALWQRQWLQGETLQAHLDYWKHHLHGLPDMLALPTDRPRPAVQTFHGTQASFPFSPSLATSLKALSRRKGVTLFMILLAAFYTLLLRYSGQEDLVVGTPIANRTASQLENLIGFFVNTLVLRANLTANPTFCQLLHQVQHITLEAYAHQDIPFERLVEALAPKRVLSHTPLFQVMFALQNVPQVDMELHGLSLEPLPVDSGTSRFDMTVVLLETEQGLQASVEYSTDLFDATSIARFMGHYQTLLTNIVKDPEQRLWSLPLLTEQEWRQQQSWNATQRAYPPTATLHSLFEVQVARAPEAIAVLSEEEQLTYSELHRQAGQVAYSLQQAGVGPACTVGLLLERSLDMVVGLLGTLKAGGAYVPLDPAFPQERLRGMLDDAQVVVVLTQQRFLNRLPPTRAHVLCLDRRWAERDASTIDQEETPSSLRVPPEQLAYIIYTSGSTGRPKGAMLSHRSICNRLLWMQDIYHLTADDRVLQKTPLSFDVSVWEVFWPLLTGAKLVLARPGGQQDSSYLVQIIQEQAISTLHFVPSMLAVFLQEPSLQACSNVTRVICSGEALPFEVQERFFQRMQAELHNLYGPTEAAVDVTWWACERAGKRRVVPIGRPIANIQLFVLDRSGNLQPPGVPGELHIAGVGLARGYVGHAELTAERFLPHPYSTVPGARLYKTGDLVRYREDGAIEFLGRMDQQVKLRGVRIELGEIAAVLEQHPAIREAVTLAREDRPGDQQLIAYLVSQPDQTPSSADLRHYLKLHLPAYMLPSAFVWLDALPLTSNGKVDRKALPPPDHSASDETYQSPGTPLEEVLAAIWQGVLGRAHIGRHDNFFALGGHSLLATQVISRIRTTLQVELPLRRLFEAPTIVDLAQRVDQVRRNQLQLELPSIKPVARTSPLPLSFAQLRLWFLDQWEPNTARYNLPFNLRLHGQLHLVALEQSFNAIVQRHEALRTTFPLVQDQPVQRISPAASVELPLIDLRDLTPEECPAVLHRLTEQEARRPFDLAQGPLLRVHLLRLGIADHVLLLTMHHVVSDGWSTGIFVRELVTLYPASANGQPSARASLPDLPIQYADFAVWQRQSLQGETLQRQLAYWRHQLQGAPELLALPSDRPRPAVQTFRGAQVSFLLPRPLTESLQALSRREGVTLFMTLLAVFQTLLLRYSGQEDIVVGTPIANRTQSQLEGLIGFFVNTLVLRTHFAGNPRFCDLLKQVQHIALEGYIHQDLPFERLVDALQPERSLSYTPLFQVLFALQNMPLTALELPHLSIAPLPGDSGTARFDMSVVFMETEQGLQAGVEYATDLFAEASIARMMGHFQMLLAGVVADSQQRVWALPLLTPGEREQYWFWNTTQRPYPSLSTLHELVEGQVQQTPDAVAVSFASQQVSYAQLNQRANQLARHLQRLGIGPERAVGICMERSLEMVVGLLGILKAGGAYLPLDPSYPRERLAFMLADAQVSVVLTQEPQGAKLPQQPAQVICLDQEWEAIAHEHGANLAPQSTPAHLAYIIYTSGSTGKPKGVMVTHRSICNRLLWMQDVYQLQRGERVLQKTPLSFDVSVWEFFWPLLTGARLVVARPGGHQESAYLVQVIREEEISTLHFVPSMLSAFLQEEEVRTCNRVKRVICSGEALPLEVQERFFQCMQAELHNLYGPTEAAVDVTWWACNRPNTQEQGSIPIGRPIANIQLFVLDRSGNLQPPGVPGELHIAGVGLARGYVGHAELTAERFLPHPYSTVPGARLYKTGDLVRYREDGAIEFLGRMDQQVKLRGVRIELGEIAAALNLHPNVCDAIVIVREDTPGNKQLVAYIVQQKAKKFSANHLRNHLKEFLPDYMLPSFYLPLEALPLTSNGKVDRRVLPAPAEVGFEREETFAAPRNPVEETLAKIWSQVLGVKQVSIHDNFFHIGGDSILSLQIISHAYKAGLQFTPKHLFQYQTLAQLAAVVRTTPSLHTQHEQSLITGPVPLTSIQQWFFDQQFSDPHHWNQAMLVEVPQTLHACYLEMSIKHLLFHHDALRLRFFQKGTAWEQFNTDLDHNVPCIHIDLSRIQETQQAPTIETIVTQTHTSLNLAEGPLLKVVLIQRGSQKLDLLLLVIHHLLIDRVSWNILLADLQTVYLQLHQGKTPQLQPKTTSYQQWAQRLREYAQSDLLRREYDYWLAAPRTRASRLPRDYPANANANANTEASTDTIMAQLSTEETLALLQEVPKAYHTHINDVLLTALVLTLGEWTGSHSLLVNLEGHGREDILENVDLTRTIGWFTTITPVLLNLQGTHELGACLKAVKEQLRGIPNKGIGYGLLRYLREDKHIAARLQAQPQAEVCFNYLGQVDQILAASTLFGSVLGESGMPHSPRAQRSYVLEINAFIVEGKLQLHWLYSSNLHTRSTIERLAQNYQHILRTLVTHCQSSDAGGYTPSDFPEAELSSQKLDELLTLLDELEEHN